MFRKLLCTLLVCWGAFPLAARADEAPQRADITMDLSAARLAYYADEKMLEARGNVQLSLSNGVVLHGDACVIDLGLQRFVVAGHVTAQTAAGQFRGAAFADFLPFRRSYFIPLETLPDRWTFLNDDYAHPEKGREMPGDAFFLPDFSGLQPFITGKTARIDPNNYIEFSPARFVFLGGTLATPALPGYVRNFSDNQNFSVNSLAGATFDLPYGVAGSSSSLDTAHLRYDQQRKTYGAFEHHTVFGANDYLVFSLNPATQPSKQWNLLGYAGGNDAALNLNAQLFTYQYGLVQPLSSNGFVDAQYTRALRGSSVRFELTQSYDSFLAQPRLGYYGDPSHPFTPNHPIVWGASWYGYDKRLANSGLFVRLTSGVSFIHDAYGVVTAQHRDANTSYLRALLYTPVYRAPFGTGLNASYQVQRTWLSFPNRIDMQTAALSDSKRLSNRLALTATYLLQSSFVQNINALYASPSNTTGLIPQPASPNGLPLIAGVLQQSPIVRDKAVVLGAAWAPSPNFQLTLSAQDNSYSPVQQPFVAGPPRYQTTADVRTRLSKTFFLDVARTYYFNWGDLRWSPAFALQVSAQ